MRVRVWPVGDTQPLVLTVDRIVFYDGTDALGAEQEVVQAVERDGVKVLLVNPAAVIVLEAIAT